jgi:hypothetical protein
MGRALVRRELGTDEGWWCGGGRCDGAAPLGGLRPGVRWCVGGEGVGAVSGIGPRRVRLGGDLFHGVVPEGAVYVGRGAPGLPASRYANPHRIGSCRRCGTVHDRVAAVAAYEAELAAQPGLVEQARRELQGRDLACWCPIVDNDGNRVPCHADVLLEIANHGDVR